MKTKKGLVAVAVIVAAWIAAFLLFGMTCPIKYFFGISCPGCGMTRAYISVILLRFNRAFYYHPLWPLVPVFGVLYFIVGKNHRTVRRVTLTVALAVMLLTWVVRMAVGPHEIVGFNPSESLLSRLYSLIRNLFKGE